MVMERYAFKFLARKVIIRANHKICETSEEILTNNLFKTLLNKILEELSQKHSPLLDIFPHRTNIGANDINLLLQTLQHLTKTDGTLVPGILKGSEVFFRDRDLLNDFVEYLYDAWRSVDRFIIYASTVYEMETRPYQAFSETIENLTHLVRQTYRNIQENITGKHPVVYRQVTAGAEIAAITSNKLPVRLPAGYEKLRNIPLIRQILLYPPLILNPPMNKRTGKFVKIDVNPLNVIQLHEEEWVCYPAKVGELLIYIYFHEKFFELGFSLCNLFELAYDEDLTRAPDGVYAFGVPGDVLDHLADFPTIFYDDQNHNILVAAVPNRDEFGYFGYLKKMVLTLHNIIMMKREAWPFHGALVKIVLKNQKEATLLIIGDTGAGKSETLEAFRILGDEYLTEMKIIADDMGSLKIGASGEIIGYGTEIGAFVRLDDLQPGYAFGQLDRTIIMCPSKVNARAVLPVTTYATIMKGHPINMILYANNYEMIDEDRPILEQLTTPEDALRIFREGTVMSKGTTTSTGLVHSYFANIFGPPQYKELHEKIAHRYFEAFFSKGIWVGQLRTRLGIPGWETKGPEAAAKELFKMIQNI